MERGWHVVGVIAAQDDAVLIRNRIPIDVPVVDEVALDGVAPGALVAVEVVAEGRAYRAMADPIALCVALESATTRSGDVAEFTRELADAPAIAVTPRTGPPDPPAVDDDYVDCTVDGRSVRYTPAQAHSVLRLAPPGNVGRVRLQSMRAARDGIAVDDAFFTDLSSIDDGAWLRRGVADTRGTVVALLAADLVADAAQTLQDLTGRPTRTIATEPEAAAVGARTTPGLPPGTVVCDIGGGTIDLIGAGCAVTAAGAGEAITTAVARVLGIPRRPRRTGQAHAGAARRGPARRARGGRPPALPRQPRPRRRDRPAVHARKCRAGAVLEQAGRRGVAQSAAGHQAGDRRGQHRPVPAGLRRTAARAGAGRGRGARRRTAADRRRGPALDAVVVGRANIDGVHGPRFAVASGLVHLYAAR